VEKGGEVQWDQTGGGGGGKVFIRVRSRKQSLASLVKSLMLSRKWATGGKPDRGEIETFDADLDIRFGPSGVGHEILRWG